MIVEIATFWACIEQNRKLLWSIFPDRTTPCGMPSAGFRGASGQRFNPVAVAKLP